MKFERVITSLFFFIFFFLFISTSSILLFSVLFLRVIIIIRIDYCSSLCLGLPYVRLRPLDGVLRAAARLIGGVSPSPATLVNSCGIPFIGFQSASVSFIISASQPSFNHGTLSLNPHQTAHCIYDTYFVYKTYT